MARLSDALQDQSAYGAGVQTVMLDPKYGGQMGWAPDLREWVSHAAYRRHNLIPILVEAPRFFSYFNDSNRWYAALRSLLELHPRSIDGLASTLTVETGDTPVGGAGERQEEVINVTRAPSTPTFVYNDLYGRPFQRFFEYWIEYGLMSPDTKYANIGTLDNYPDDMLPDQYAATMLFIEPDPTHRTVVKSWLCTNMFPKTAGEKTGARDLTSALTIPELSIEFSALTQVGLGVDQFAQRILEDISITDANPFLRNAFVQEIDANSESAPVGYSSRVSDVAGDQVTTFG